MHSETPLQTASQKLQELEQRLSLEPLTAVDDLAGLAMSASEAIAAATRDARSGVSSPTNIGDLLRLGQHLERATRLCGETGQLLSAWHQDMVATGRFPESYTPNASIHGPEVRGRLLAEG